MPEKPYDHNQIELKWHERWQNADFYKAEENSAKPKYYVLEMLPYPSGTLHIGHIRNYSIGDALARYKWMRGYNVLHPMGWDAFGLPAENAAIANKRPPREWTLSQHRGDEDARTGASPSATTGTAKSPPASPNITAGTSGSSCKMLERGLAYRKKALVNWCPKCATVLANEQVVDGCCWRHEDTPVEQRALEQWFLQNHRLRGRIAARHGAARRRLAGARAHHAAQLDRPLRRRGDRFQAGRHGRTDPRLHHARRYHLRRDLRDPGAGASARTKRCSMPTGKARAKAMVDARAKQGPGDIEKEGFFTGHYAVNPFSGERIPIWVGNFVLMGYGTGAIMAVPAHDERDFEFCRKYGIAIRPVIRPVDGALGRRAGHDGSRSRDYGIVENSGAWSGLDQRRSAPQDGRVRRGARLRQSRHHVSHQGLGHLAPALLGHADPGDPLPECGVVPVPEDQLPVLLPRQIADHRQGPLAARERARVRERDVPEVRRRRRGARPTPWIPSSIPPGISTATAIRTTTRRRSIRRRSPTGSRSINTSAAWSTRFCT